MSIAARWIVLAASVVASVAHAETVPFDSPRWQIEARESRVEQHLGRPSLFLANGAALLEGVSFLDGTLEFDIAFTGERGFMGGMWRVQDPANHEQFYVRPHQSGQPDANQYTPAFDGLTCWQLYHGAGYSTALEYPLDQWIHIKVVFSGTQAEVYVDSDEPVLFVPELKREPQAGGIGLMASFAPAHFSNVSFEPDAPGRLRGTPPRVPEAPDGVVSRWWVSRPFDGARLQEVTILPESLSRLEGTTLVSDGTGIANLGRVASLEDGNTVLASVTLTAEEAVVASVRFGYSDRVRVYLDGELLYAGDNTYRSRDYRYLGTIGLFDELPLRLRAGDNELSFAVSESFGGWGILAALDDAENVAVRPSLR